MLLIAVLEWAPPRGVSLTLFGFHLARPQLRMANGSRTSSQRQLAHNGRWHGQHRPRGLPFLFKSGLGGGGGVGLSL